VVGIPVTPNQTVTVTYDETRLDHESFTIDGVDAERQSGERLIYARWSYDTTNHPFTPTRGAQLSVTPIVAWFDSAGVTKLPAPVDEPSPFVPSAFHRNSVGVSVDAARYFELSERNSVSAGAELGWAHLDERSSVIAHGVETTNSYLIANAGFSHSLWTQEQQKGGDSRFEYTLRLIKREKTERLSDVPYSDDQFQAAFAWVRRSSFGTIRLGVGYGW